MIHAVNWLRISFATVNKHRHSPLRARTNCVWLNAKFAGMIMTRRLKSLCAESVTFSTALNAQSTRWRLFVRTAAAVSSATVWKRTKKSSAVSIAHAHPAPRS